MNQKEIMRKDPIKGIGLLLEQRQEEILWYNSAKATSVCDSGRQPIEWMPLLYEVRFNTTLIHLILSHPFSHTLLYRKPVLPLITHTAGWFLVIFARGVYFHSSIVQIGYCLWCMILKADRLLRDRRQPRRLSEQANKQIQKWFLLMLRGMWLPEHDEGTFILYLCHHWSVRNIDDPGQKLACLSK